MIVVGDLCIEPRARSVKVDGVPVKCTSAEYAILECLAREAGRVVSREQLMLSACERQLSPLDRALDVHISHLRSKLNRIGGEIVTVRGVGYLLASPRDQ